MNRYRPRAARPALPRGPAPRLCADRVRFELLRHFFERRRREHSACGGVERPGHDGGIADGPAAVGDHSPPAPGRSR